MNWKDHFTNFFKNLRAIRFPTQNKAEQAYINAWKKSKVKPNEYELRALLDQYRGLDDDLKALLDKYVADGCKNIDPILSVDMTIGESEDYPGGIHLPKDFLRALLLSQLVTPLSLVMFIQWYRQEPIEALASINKQDTVLTEDSQNEEIETEDSWLEDSGKENYASPDITVETEKEAIDGVQYSQEQQVNDQQEFEEKK